MIIIGHAEPATGFHDHFKAADGFLTASIDIAVLIT